MESVAQRFGGHAIFLGQLIDGCKVAGIERIGNRQCDHARVGCRHSADHFAVFRLKRGGGSDQRRVALKRGIQHIAEAEFYEHHGGREHFGVFGLGQQNRIRQSQQRSSENRIHETGLEVPLDGGDQLRSVVLRMRPQGQRFSYA